MTTTRLKAAAFLAIGLGLSACATQETATRADLNSVWAAGAAVEGVEVASRAAVRPFQTGTWR